MDRYYYICPKCGHLAETAGWEIADLRCPVCKALMRPLEQGKGRRKLLYEGHKERQTWR